MGTALLLALLVATPSRAEEPPIKVGMIYTFSGPAGSMGEVTDYGVKTFVAQHGDTVAGRKVEIIRRDVSGQAPDLAKRLAQALVVQDHVDFLTGIDFTPNAVAIGQVSTASKTPAVDMNASGTPILKNAPYMIRVSQTNQQNSGPMGQWAAKNGIRTAFIAVADFAPGLDAAAAFTKTFTAGGGKIVGELHLPQESINFAAELQRIKDSKPDAVYVFLTPLPQAPIFLRQFKDAGLEQQGIKVLASGELTDEFILPKALGDVALGVITSHNYTYLHDSELNRSFKKTFDQLIAGKSRPTQMSVSAYDGMNAIYKVIEAQQGHLDPDKTMALWKGMTFESPRGMIEIDPETRDIIQDISIRRVEKVDGELQNVEIDRFPRVPPGGL
jgi:branched-chain amino acid transport system substrate-binding protein